MSLVPMGLTTEEQLAVVAIFAFGIAVGWLAAVIWRRLVP